ncbi:cob(I)yrinic acid a,c-diamide adenosyltransferase [Brevibacillus daliensis]|uniref:cob(I)yrinic acid a,c-diamide adenosyltransferase n=1 Tax=Brevibacillus daliensis TaxID=2892995 RepID=UPI001E52AB5C|nr:cob(I)yrinic acid a,c-diamide adenosyltransferase [Brevibacillus daliensis]
MKIYTKTGDKGQTSLVYGQRVPKYAPRVEVYGTCDEANSQVGLAVSYLPARNDFAELEKTLHIIQTKLFHIGSELSTPEGKKVNWPITEGDITLLEEQIDKINGGLPPLTNFILPGGHPAGAAMHVARTIVRKAERDATKLIETEPFNPLVLSYLNRLSDYLYVAARFVNQQLRMPEAGLHDENKSE